VTPPAAASGTAGLGLLEDYLDHVAGLGLRGRAMRDRVRIARDFLARHPDLEDWMAAPATVRAAELKRTGAWPLVCYAIGAGQLRLDLDLAGIKHLTGLGQAIEDRDPAGRGGPRRGPAAGLDTLLGGNRPR
jgi:hypothetical protein